METMRSLTAAALVMLLGITTAKAQSASDVNFGIKAGVNFSTLKTGLDAVSVRAFIAFAARPTSANCLVSLARNQVVTSP
jgi:hypothetical protein